MRDNFRPALENLKEFEGFRSNDPNDAGGETVWGLARRYHPTIPWPPTWEQAAEIYLNEYWTKGGCDILPFPVDVVHFDAMVNPGELGALLFLKESGEHLDPLHRCVEYLTLRQEYYLERVAKRPANLEYICGWIRRTIKMMKRTVINAWDAELLRKGGSHG